MYLKKNSKKKIIIFFLILLILIFSLIQTKLIRLGNIDQELRILLKQPVLFSTYNSNKKNLENLYFAIKNISTKKKFEKIKLDIPFENYQILKKDRRKAKEKGLLRNPKRVKANVFWKDKVYPAEIRLKGDYNDHIEYNKQWSLKINLKKDKTISSFNEFSLTSHSTRAYPDSFINSKFLEKIGIITPKRMTVVLEVNGEDWGLMSIEEGLSDIFLELRNKKSVPIFKLSNEEHMTVSSKILNKKNKFEHQDKILKNIAYFQGFLEVETYNENKIFKKTNIPGEHTNLDLFSTIQTINNYINIKNINEKYSDSVIDKEILNYFDIKKFALLIASNLVWGEVHSLFKINSRFYIDPYTQKINPIPTDFHYINPTLGLKRNDIIELNLEKVIKNNFFDPISEIYKFVIKSEEFKREYFLALKIIEENFEFIYDEIELFCKPFGGICTKKDSVYGFSIGEDKKKVLSENLKFLKYFGDKIFLNLNNKNKKNYNYLPKNILKDYLSLIDKKIFLRIFNNGEIEIFNLSSSKISIEKLEIINSKNCNIGKCKDKINFKPRNQLIINESNDLISILKISLFTEFFNEAPSSNFDLNEFNLAKVYFKNNVTGDYEHLQFYIEDYKFSKSYLVKKSEVMPNFLIKGENEYVIKKGNYKINKKIIIPKNFSLIVEAGTNITFSSDSYIYLQNGSIQINGSEDENVIFRGDKSWGGLYVSDCLKPTIINHTIFKNISYFQHENIQLTGGLNFYNCNVKISHSKFIKSYSEDFLNLINSNFNLKYLEFSNTTSDAIDLDYSDGVIENIDLQNIGGDAIDTSGSEVRMKNIKTFNIIDKSISAGEKSTILLNDVEIRNSGIGIASKDSSIVKGKKVKIFNSINYDLTAFRKKNFYEGGVISLKDVLHENKNLIQKDSFALINEKIINTKKFNSKLLYSK